MKELSLHILDIVENSVAAKANAVLISIDENTEKDLITIMINDNGKGMDEDTLNKVVDPFYTSRTTRRVGLGIPLLKSAAESCNGSFSIQSKPGIGTEVLAIFQRSHIDRMPLGDLTATFLNLVVAYPDIDWLIKYKVDGKQFIYDNKLIRNELQDVPYSDPLVLTFLREYLSNGIIELRKSVS